MLALAAMEGARVCCAVLNFGEPVTSVIVFLAL